MATNYIKRFAQNAGTTNILTPAQYDIDPRRLSGHLPGVADNALENTVLQQTSLMTSALALFTASNQLQDITSSLTDAQISAYILQAVKNSVGYGQYVTLTDDQNPIDGIKTFTSSPIVPTPTTATQAANKGYVDGAIVAGTSNYLNKGINGGPNTIQDVFGSVYFKGQTQVPTSPQFGYISLDAANCGFVNSKMGSYRNFLTVSTSQILTINDIGKTIFLQDGAYLQLPSATIVEPGSSVRIICTGSSGFSIAPGAVEGFVVGGSGGIGLPNIVTEYFFKDGDDVIATSSGFSWHLWGQGTITGSARFLSQTIGGFHVQRIAGKKMIIAGETSTVANDATITVTFPFSFSDRPTVVASIRHDATTQYESFAKVVGTPTTTQVTFRVEFLGGPAPAGGQFVTFIAIGDITI